MKLINKILTIFLICLFVSSAFAHPLDDFKNAQQERHFFLQLYDDLFLIYHGTDIFKGKLLKDVADRIYSDILKLEFKPDEVAVEIHGFEGLKNVFLVKIVIKGKFRSFYKLNIMLELKGVIYSDEERLDV